MLCTDLVTVKHFPEKRLIEPLRCRRWSCEGCAPLRRQRVMKQAAGGKPTKFLTLTSSPETANDPDAAARILAEAWAKLRREIKRRYGIGTVPFLAVFEATKQGWPHLHILLRLPFVDQRWLSRRMAHHARAPIVDIRAVKSRKQAANYVAKYLGKDPHHFQGRKRYWTSRDWEVVKWEKPPLDPAALWKVEVLRRNWQDVAYDLYRAGVRMALAPDSIEISHREWSRAFGGWP